MTTPPSVALTAREVGVIVAQSALRGVPYVGATLEHLAFAHLNELRMKRMEQTLTEVALALGEIRAQAMTSEQFMTLLESITPDLARSVSEERRTCLRQLLINAAVSADTPLAEAGLAASLVKEIEPPGLALLAALSRVPLASTATVTSRPVPQVYVGEFDYTNVGKPQQVIPYQWVVVEYWCRYLQKERLIGFGSHDARGGFGGVQLAELGRFIVNWCIERRQ